MPTHPLILLSLIYLGLIQQCAANFTFTYSEATECDDFSVSWTGTAVFATRFTSFRTHSVSRRRLPAIHAYHRSGVYH